MAERVELTRRRALGLAGASALGLAGGGGLVRALPALAQASDSTLLAAPLAIERTLSIVYTAAGKSGLLGGPDRTLAETLRQNAVLAARELDVQLGEGGAEASQQSGTAEIPGLDSVRSARGYFELALGFETQAYLAYLDAVGSSRDSGTVRLACSLAATGAQHLAVLRQQMGLPATPSAFETGLEA